MKYELEKFRVILNLSAPDSVNVGPSLTVLHASIHCTQLE